MARCVLRFSFGKPCASYMGSPLFEFASVASSLDCVPVLEKNAVLDTKNVGHHPIRRQSPRVSSVNDDEIALPTIVLDSHLRVGGRLLTRLNNPLRPVRCAHCARM